VWQSLIYVNVSSEIQIIRTF